MSRSVFHSGVRAETARTAGRRIRPFSLFFFAGLSLAVLSGCQSRRDSPGAAAAEAGQFLLAVRDRAAGERGSAAILAVVVYEERLTCTPCLESLGELFDSLRNVPRDLPGEDILLIAAGRGGSSAAQQRRMEAWSAAHHLGYPLIVISADSLREKFLGQSSVLFVDREGRMRMKEPIPLAPGAIAQIMGYLRAP